ncbi:MAG TPA: hypothetical protein VD695_02140 [Gaiellaceae bacterium]|nr:hypothetical protein [Gaiellaceae bacterium]
MLSKLVTWMRGQPGTSDLRALVYMDEVFGFVPPTAEPPAKKPILTILKQRRASGVGMVLATPNPVDLDYKAMVNAGTWLVGRLQTERDKARVLEALKSAAGDADVGALDAAVGGLGKRRFLLVSAKAAEPSLFETRWAMSYLRGPLTRDQVAELMRDAVRPQVAPAAAGEEPAPGDGVTSVAPPGAAGTTVGYLDPAAPWAGDVGAVAGGTRLRAFLAARVAVRFDDARADVDEQEEYEALFGPLDGGLDLEPERAVDYDDRDFAAEPPPGAAYTLPRAEIGNAAFFRAAARGIERRLASREVLELQRNKELKLVSRPGEAAEAFAERCDLAAQAAEDAEAAKIRDRLEAKQDKLEQALELARRRREELDAQVRSRQANELAVGAGEVLGALLGGRRSARSITRALGRAASKRGSSTTAAERLTTADTKADRLRTPWSRSSWRSRSSSRRSTPTGRRRRPRSRRSRSARRRATCASPRSPSSGCRPPDRLLENERDLEVHLERDRAVLDDDLLPVDPGGPDVADRLAGLLETLAARVLEALRGVRRQLDDLGYGHAASLSRWARNVPGG